MLTWAAHAAAPVQVAAICRTVSQLTSVMRQLLHRIITIGWHPYIHPLALPLPSPSLLLYLLPLASAHSPLLCHHAALVIYLSAPEAVHLCSPFQLTLFPFHISICSQDAASRTFITLRLPVLQPLERKGKLFCFESADYIDAVCGHVWMRHRGVLRAQHTPARYTSWLEGMTPVLPCSTMVVMSREYREVCEATIPTTYSGANNRPPRHWDDNKVAKCFTGATRLHVAYGTSYQKWTSEARHECRICRQLSHTPALITKFGLGTRDMGPALCRQVCQTEACKNRTEQHQKLYSKQSQCQNMSV